MNLVYELPFIHHQRSPAHYMDSGTTPTVGLHPGLQFPSLIALIAHTAEGTDHTHTSDYADCTKLFPNTLTI